MSLISFINKTNFEVKDELEEYIYCDYEIRYIIAELNKKGYITNFSCAGHNEVGLFWPLHKEEIYNLEEYLQDMKKDNALHFIKKDDNYFYHKDEKVWTCPYISFADDYNFETYPQKFNYKVVNGRSYLSKKIDFYKDKQHMKKKTDPEIEKELEQTYKDLEEWVNTLSSISNNK